MRETANNTVPRNMAEYWREVGPKLEAIRREELRRFDYRSQLHTIDGLLEIGFRFRRPQELSGLIEWSRRLREHYTAQGCLEPTNIENVQRHLSSPLVCFS